MSITFTKLFSSITESTVWCEPAHTRLVWITMLAMADRKGRVWASVPGLANRARVPLEDCEKALETLLAPDRYSRTPDFEGRRIEPIDGGWRLLNHAKYRDMRDEEIRLEQNRIAQAKYREKVSKVADSKPQSAQADTYTEAEAESKEKTKTGRAIALPDWLPKESWDAWLEVRKRVKAPNTERALKLAIGDLEKLREQGHDPGGVLDNATKRGWRGLYAPANSTGTPDYSSVMANIKD